MTDAIAGYYRFDDPAPDAGDAERMLDCLTPRAPSGYGVVCDGPVGLGHGLAATERENAQRERRSTRTPRAPPRTAIVADARIDNRDELLPLLGFPAAEGRHVPDDQLILAAYEAWGEQCPARLIGDYAIAIWDREHRRLFCARDALGIRPLYYYHSPRGFAFASEVRALLALRWVPMEIDHERVVDFLLSRLENKNKTAYRGILRLAPGHSLVVRRCRVKRRSYWSLDPAREVRLDSDEEYADAFRECITEAVACRIRAAERIGATLSGGLDSSSVTCVALRELRASGREPLHTFSGVFDSLRQSDEREFVQEVAKLEGIAPHYIHIERLSPLSALRHLVHSQDDLINAPNLFLHQAVYRAAKDCGVQVVLDGFDGDTVVSHGVAHLIQLTERGQWRTLWRELRAVAKNFGVPAGRVLRQRVMRPVLSRLAARSRLPRLRRPEVREDAALLAPQLAAAAASRESSLPRGLRQPPSSLDPSREHHYRRLSSGLLPHTFEVVDQVALSYGVRPLFPFHDRRLVELCLALPAEQKLRGGWTRYVLRAALKGIVPESIRCRGGKGNLSPMLWSGLLRNDAAALEGFVRRRDPQLEAFVSRRRLEEAYRSVTAARCQHGFLGADLQKDVNALWKGMTLALWLQRRPEKRKLSGSAMRARNPYR